MNCEKIQDELDDFVSGELERAQRLEIEQHLLACPQCRSYADWSRSIAARAAMLPDSIEPSRDLWPGIESRLTGDGERPVSVVSLNRPGSQSVPERSRRGHLAIAAALLVLIGLSTLLTIGLHNEQPPAQVSWTVTGVAGAPMISARPASQGGALRVGDWLETDAKSRAEIEIGNIGQVELRPNSRVRVLRSGADEHRMALDKGSMSALILAPPRLFLVETPSALAVDLGCAYDLTVDQQGDGHLAVTAGWVSLEFRGRQSLVPAGASCISRRNLGPGTPYFLDSSSEFQTALDAVDLGHSLDASLARLLAGARVRDTLSLWHLLPRLPRERREQVWERLNELVPAPPAITRQGILELDQAMMDRWKDDLEQFWF